jgi:uncharacterized membrane protein YcaP (DUF421 family)
MESIFRATATYLFVWLIFRIAGKRSLAQITTFDAVLILIISETTQSALTDNDNSLTNSCLLILTMVGLDIVLSYFKEWSPTLEKIMDGAPLVILDERGLKEDCMKKERVDEHDILHAARQLRGLPNLDQIQYAILEQSGGITIVKKAAGA